jgi:AcrR family transcriptional regulator
MHSERPPQPVRRRARTLDAKADRRALLIDAALRLSRRLPFDEVTMAAVAAELGVTKGTVYLYFPTKESLFLAVLDAQMQAWYAAVDHALTALTAPTGSEVAAVLADAFLARPDLTRLLALLEGVLERNIDLETAVAFKRATLTRTAHTAALLEAVWPSLPKGSGVGVLLRCRALLVGLEVMAHPSAVVRAAFDANPELAPFEIDFAREVRRGITALVLGAGTGVAIAPPVN